MASPNVDAIGAVVEYVRQTFAIDPTRVYMTGKTIWMANRKHTMDLATVLDRVERMQSVEWSDEGRDIMWHALYRDLLIAISQNKCADLIACASAALRPGTILDEAGV